MKPNASSAPASMTKKPTARSILLKRVRNCGVRSCNAIKSASTRFYFPFSFWFFDRQQFLEKLRAGRLDLRPCPEHGEPLLFQNRELLRSSSPRLQISGRYDQCGRTSLQQFVSARQIIQKLQPPVQVPGIQPGKRIIKQEEVR